MDGIHTMSEIRVLLFGPEMPVAGQPVQCVVLQDAIHIRSHQTEVMQTVRLDALQAIVAGFDHDQLQLTWQPADQPAWSLIPADAGEQKKLVAALPHEDVQGLRHWKRATSSQSRVWKSIIYSFGFVVVALSLLVWQHDRVTSWAANRISMKTEKRIGESLLKSLNPEANFLKQGKAVKTVQDIGQRLTAGSAYQYQWYVAKDPAVNAFAIPGGIIVVNSGLLKLADSPNELAGVLAHEIQHVEQRHALKNMLNSAAMATVMLVVLGDTNAIVMMMAHQISTQYFSRQVESEADNKGVQLLQEKNIDARGMVSLFKRMDSVPGEKEETRKDQPAEKKSEVAGWFSSHPDTLIRINDIEEYLAAHPCSTCGSLEWDKPAMQAELAKTVKN
jgi:Zn-dependent protease with chaperone function